MIGGISVMVLYYCVLKRTKGGKGRTFLFPGCFMMVIVLCVMKEDVKGWRLESHGHEGKSQGMKKNERMKWGEQDSVALWERLWMERSGSGCDS